MPEGRRVSVIGLGYAGLQVAVAFGLRERVIGYDVDPRRIQELKAGVDRNREVGPTDLQSAKVRFTSDPEELRTADFHIISVPTPIDEAKRPDLRLLLRACQSVGARVDPGDIVIIESTVYPGATEEDCVPVLETASGLKCGSDFFVAYSPERINPGDPSHSFTKITKVVAAQEPEVLEVVAKVYGSVVSAGVYRAPSIRVAEVAKVFENTQRDLNIALVNELAVILGRLGIDTHDVLSTAATKWNFLPFAPGLVGGHCLGVDPYYLIHKADLAGYQPQVILTGRKTNDGMGCYVAREVMRALDGIGISIPGSTITVLGLSFKENVPDTRNSRVVDMVREFRRHGVSTQVHDPLVDRELAEQDCGIVTLDRSELSPADAVVLAVAHTEYREAGWQGISALLAGGGGLVADVPGVLNRTDRPKGVLLWRL